MERGRTASHQAVVRGVLGPRVAAQGPQGENLRRALRAVRMPGRAPRGRGLRMLLIAPVALAVLAACGGRAGHPGTAAATATAAPGSVRATPESRPATGLPSSPSTASRLSPVAGWRAGKDWTYIPATRRVVALTFDAGANADGVASILATLRREHAPATFFLTGNFVREFPASARAIAGAGYRIGDHTITHPHLTQLSDAAVRHEILGAARQIIAATGADPAPLFRFPYGDADARVIAIANQLGFVPARWTVDTLGWEGTSGHITASIVIARVLAGLRAGEIVLLHVGSNPVDHSALDAEVLPAVISALRARGYSFVTLDALAR